MDTMVVWKRARPIRVTYYPASGAVLMLSVGATTALEFPTVIGFALDAEKGLWRILSGKALAESGASPVKVSYGQGKNGGQASAKAFMSGAIGIPAGTRTPVQWLAIEAQPGVLTFRIAADTKKPTLRARARRRTTPQKAEV